MVAANSEGQNILLQLLVSSESQSTFEKRSGSFPKIEDETAFLKLCTATHLAPIVHEKLTHVNGVTSTVLESLANTRNQVLVRNMRLYTAFQWFMTEMNGRSIPVIPLKGIYAAEKLYKDISLRHLSDIDLLIRPENVKEVVDLMGMNNWQIKKAEAHSDLSQRELEVAHPYTFYKDGVTIELHTHLYDRKIGADISIPSLWGHSSEETFSGKSICQFEPEMLLQHWCLHLHKHLNGHEVKMLSFWDIRLLLAQNTAFDWKRFEVLCQQYKCTHQAFGVLYLCAKYWDVDVPEACMQQDSELEFKFLQFLERKPKTAARMAEFRLSANLKRMQRLETLPQKVTFLVRYIFPKKEFMHQNYNIRSGGSVVMWYAYRPLELTAKLCLALGKKFLN